MPHQDARQGPEQSIDSVSQYLLGGFPHYDKLARAGTQEKEPVHRLKAVLRAAWRQGPDRPAQWFGSVVQLIIFVVGIRVIVFVFRVADVIHVCGTIIFTGIVIFRFIAT